MPTHRPRHFGMRERGEGGVGRGGVSPEVELGHFVNQESYLYLCFQYYIHTHNSYSVPIRLMDEKIYYF